MTPKSFLSFLQGYKHIYNEKNGRIENLAKKMSLGLSKLIDASSSVDSLQQELVEKNQDILVATNKATEVLFRRGTI